MARSRTVILVVAGFVLAALSFSVYESRSSTVDATELPSAVESAVDDAAVHVVRLAVAGDIGTGGGAAYRTAGIMDLLDEQFEYDALLLLGDNIYPSGNPDDAQSKVFDPFGPTLDNGTRLIAALGNHDIRDGNGPEHALALGMPDFWYSTIIENVMIITLDSNQPDEPEQLRWLESTLAGERPAWTIVTMHHPAYSAGDHGSDEDVQDYFVPLFDAYGVDLVFAGHDHDYQRSRPINGAVYIVSGGAAKLRSTGSADFTEVSESTHHFVDLAVHDDRIVGVAVDHEGNAIDTFDLR